MIRSALIALTLAAACVPLARSQAPRFSAWKIVGPGGGGTMINPTISPRDPAVVVEHCDMTGAYITHDNGESWRMFNLHGVVQTFAFDPSDARILYAGNIALWRSRNMGRSWSMIFPNPRENTVLHQVGDESDLFLTTGDKSYPDGGEITKIAVDPHNSRQIYLAFSQRRSASAIFASSDGGALWKRLAAVPSPVLQMAVHAGNLIVVAGGGTYRIEENGKKRETGKSPAGISVASMADGGDAVWIYATTKKGEVFVSENSGRSWRAVTPSLTQGRPWFHAIAASRLHPQFAYAGFEGWRPGAKDGVGEYAGGSAAGEVVWEPPSGRGQEFDGIARTEDGGKSWQIVFEESPLPARNMDATWIERRMAEHGDSVYFVGPWSLGVAPSNPNICYATDLFRTYRTLDGGRHWQGVASRRVRGNSWTTRGLDVTTNYGIQFDPFDSRHLYMDNTDIGLFRSDDDGASWQSSTTGVPESWRNTTYWLAFDPRVKGLIWGAFSGVHDLPRTKDWRHRSPLTYTGGVGVSTDGGRTWKPSNAGMPPTSVTDIVLDPSSPVGKRTLYATGFGRGVYKSVDNGRTWALKNDGITGREPFAWRLTLTREGVLYLVVARRSDNGAIGNAGDGALYRSTNGADSWMRMNLPPGVNGPTDLVVDPGNPRRMYLTAWGRRGTLVDRGGGVFLSTDGGRNWKPIFERSQHIYSLTMAPGNPHMLYITGFDDGAYRSTDAGRHWSRIRGYDFKWGHRIVPDLDDPSMIYIDTYGGGVWHGPTAGDPEASGDILTPIPVAHGRASAAARRGARPGTAKLPALPPPDRDVRSSRASL